MGKKGMRVVTSTVDPEKFMGATLAKRVHQKSIELNSQGITPDSKRLAKELGATVKDVEAAIDLLISRGFIQRKK